MQEETGLLISVSGPWADIETATGEHLKAHVRRNAPPVITGDQVCFERQQDHTAVITGHRPRHSLLYRPEHNGRQKLMAANADCLVIVTSPPPVFSEERIDRYLIAATILNIAPLILINKTDLLTPETEAALSARLVLYRDAGWPVCWSSTRIPGGLQALQQTLAHKTAVLTGLSGVGKSSIIQTLTGNPDIRTGEVSAKGSGRHTTTVTRLYTLPGGGRLIDSPGIRDFGLWKMPPEETARGYPEFRPFLGQCRFRNCVHLSEPDCAVVQAAAAGHIDSGRLRRYQQIAEDQKP